MIPVTNPYNNWQGDNSTTKFDFDFLVENQSQLLVFVTAADTVRQLTYETDYTITGFGNNNGGYITYPINEENDKLQNDETITLQLVLPITQQSEYGTSSELNPKDIEHSLDYLTRIAQIQNRQLERSVKVAEGSGTDTEKLVNSVNTIYENIDVINAVNNNKTNINAVNDNAMNINTVANSIENVNTVGNDIANVNAVASNETNINAVNDNAMNINTVANSIENVNTVGNNIANVNAVVSNETNINAVNDNAANINTVANSIENVNTVGNDIAIVNAVVSNETNINAVNDNATNINTVANSIENVDTVGNDIANVNAVASNETNINAVNDNAANINTVAGAIENVNTVGNDIANVNAVASNETNINAVNDNATNINTVATNISNVSAVADATADIEVCADNIEDIKSAPSFAEQAKDSAKQSIYRDLFQCNSLNVNAEKPKTYFEHIENLKHSTFDLSKFTVVGSPTITDDGVALTTSTGNYIKTSVVNFSTASTWKIKGKFKSQSTAVESNILSGSTNPYLAIVFNGVSKNIRIALGDGSTWFVSNVTGASNLSLNTEYEYEFIYDGTGYLLNLNGSEYISKQTSEYKVGKTPVVLGVNRVGAEPFANDKTIDLSQFSITVDGVEVFSGNKTGMDVIKPDNYTVVGSPVISDDGVASGFSSSNYLKQTNLPDLSLANTWKIEGKFKQTTSLPNEFRRLFAYAGDNIVTPSCTAQIYDNKLNFAAYSTTTGDTIFASSTGRYAVELNKDYWFELEFTGDKYVGRVSTDGVNYLTFVDFSSSTKVVSRTGGCIFGIGQQSVFDIGSIDLNSFKIYVDGNLVYQPCLKIPYTESKTGSKIVDAFYRDRVQDVYSQGFDKYYYTLDEANKSVDELTGFNQTLSTSKTDDSTVTKFADGTVEICGRVTAAGTINLPVTLKDTNYFCTLPTTEKTTTSFTTTQTGDYILKGELA